MSEKEIIEDRLAIGGFSVRKSGSMRINRKWFTEDETKQYESYVAESVKADRPYLPIEELFAEEVSIMDPFNSENQDERYVEMAADPIGSILLQMYETNKAKRADYTGGRGIFANFIEAGDHVGISSGHGIEYMIQTKQSRIKSLIRPGIFAQNESLDDSLVDRAVYSVIAVAAYRDGQYASK